MQRGAESLEGERGKLKQELEETQAAAESKSASLLTELQQTKEAAAAASTETAALIKVGVRCSVPHLTTPASGVDLTSWCSSSSAVPLQCCPHCPSTIVMATTFVCCAEYGGREGSG